MRHFQLRMLPALLPADGAAFLLNATSFLLGLACLIGAPFSVQASILEATESIEFGQGYSSVDVDYTSDNGSVGQAFHREASVSFAPALNVLPINAVGDVNASASYLVLRAFASGQYEGPIGSGNVPVPAVTSTASSTDTLTFTSPGMSGTGFVAYTFDLAGSILNHHGADVYISGAQAIIPYAGMSLNVTQGPSYLEAADGKGFEIYDGQPGGIIDVPGIFPNPDEIDVIDESFVTRLLPFTFGESFDLKVALQATVSFANFVAPIGQNYGIIDESALASSNFYDTVKLTGVQIFDVNGNPISNFAIQSDSGTAYPLGAATPVPEPAGIVMSSILFGMFSVLWAYKRLKRPALAA